MTEENGITVTGLCNDTKDADIKSFEEANGLKSKKMNVMEKWMTEAFSRDEGKQN